MAQAVPKPKPRLPDEDVPVNTCLCCHCYNLMEAKDLRWLTTSFLQLVCAGTLMGVSYIVKRWAADAYTHSIEVFKWCFFVSILAFSYVAGRFLDWCVYTLVSKLALVWFLSSIMFYALAFDGVVAHLTWIVVGWSIYDKPGVDMNQRRGDFEKCFLLFLLLAILAVIRKAFLRHVLRDRLRQQYEQLSVKVMKAKSIIYRLSVGAHGALPPKYDDLPRPLRVIENEQTHILSKRSYAEFNKMLSHSYGSGFFVQLDPFHMMATDVLVEITSSKEMQRLGDRLFNMYYKRLYGITEMNTTTAASGESSGEVPRRNSFTHLLSGGGDAIWHGIASLGHFFWGRGGDGSVPTTVREQGKDKAPDLFGGKIVPTSKKASSGTMQRRPSLTEPAKLDIPRFTFDEFVGPVTLVPIGSKATPETMIPQPQRMDSEPEVVLPDAQVTSPSNSSVRGIRLSSRILTPASTEGQSSNATSTDNVRNPMAVNRSVLFPRMTTVSTSSAMGSPQATLNILTNFERQTHTSKLSTMGPVVPLQPPIIDIGSLPHTNPIPIIPPPMPRSTQVTPSDDKPPRHMPTRSTPGLMPTLPNTTPTPTLTRSLTSGIQPPKPIAIPLVKSPSTQLTEPVVLPPESSKYPTIPTEYLKTWLTTNVGHIPYDPDKETDRDNILYDYFCAVVDINGDGQVTSKELQSGISSMVKDWKALRKSWSGHETVSQAYHISTLVFYFIIAVGVWIAVFQIPYTKILLPMATIAAATAYAVGGSVSSLFQSLLFIVVYNPYEVGDKVIIENFQSEAVMTVHEINVTTTTFEHGNGKRVKLANQVLMSKGITNYKRSSFAGVTLKFTVGYRTTKDQLVELKDRIQSFLKKHSTDWKPSISLTIDDASLAGPLNFSVSVSYLKTWADSGDLSTAKSHLIHACVKYMLDLNIEYMEAPKIAIDMPASAYASLREYGGGNSGGGWESK